MSQSSNSSSSPLISRRTALKLMGIGTVGAGLGYSRFAKPQPTLHQKDDLDLPFHLNQPKTVIVVGAGLAGLACAYELSQRGFAVTLLEKSPQLGGKIASWKIQVGDDSFMMEHGFHGFFPQYYNLKSVVEELNITENFKSLEFYSLVFRDNTYQPEVFRPSNSAFPWNIVDLAISSPNRFRWGINLTHIKHLQVFKAITGFRIPKSFKNLDSLSVADWVGTDFPQGLYDLYFLPFAKSSLNAPDVLSTGELLQFFHFYFFGNPEGLAFNGTRDDMGTSLVQPIARAIARNGGKIITQASVSNINCKNGQVESLSYQQGTNQTNVPFWVDKNLLLTQDEQEYYGAGDRAFIAQNDSEALSLSCTHQGCTVQKQADGGFLCPCHGARYDAQGRVVQGPAQEDLPKYAIAQRQDDKVQLVAASPTEPEQQQTLTADYYVIAADVPGTQHLFNLMEGDVNPQVAQQVEKLAIADPFAVARFWFDRDFEWEHSNFTSLSGYDLTDSITLYHRIQEQFIQWSKRTGFSVIELHAYCYKEKDFPTQADLLATFERELYEIVPSLRGATVLHQELVNQKNFSGYPPNSYADRPQTTTAIPNLMFAGDWVKMPFPCGLMERAVSSGFLAANGIVQQEGLQRRILLSVNPEGILKI
ncbi:FAD-dependent oxidoreductase [Lusitaniella coriacea LEGE 07157]|uniref:FAD-dependent oxidoreductase n=1 Tax=Lusitaniella coriacea LEGE 07157 TaxID=945747 RepID=A0A8J7DUV5_9CYAN|nr:FAD-dependent oxidoreductase [Lusitaniella coriacea]MBE9114695.1 FAD-dependent oxidoreductase [Lusitaniella coriacea LEGE 07157]